MILNKFLHPKVCSTVSAPGRSPLHATHRCKKNLKGFTLLEVVVAIAILATAFFSLLVLHNQTITMSYRIQSVNETTFLLREKMAEVILERADPQGIISDRNPPLEERYPSYEMSIQEIPLSTIGVLPVELKVPLTYYQLTATAKTPNSEGISEEKKGESTVIGFIMADTD